jgi:hypothetical protein
MSRFRGPLAFWAAACAVAISTAAPSAQADINLYEKDGWGFRTSGMIGAHFQLAFGDGDPSTTHGVLVGGKIFPVGAQDTRDNSLVVSRVRSGFIGTQIGFGVTRQINEDLHIDSLMAVSLNDISSNRGQTLPKEVDFREAWAALVSPYGSLKFGRMFSIFGSASAPVILIAYRYGVGNPCFISTTTIACASVGAGPLYAGFDAQMRYISPRLAGLELQFAVSDPVVAPDFKMTPLPRFDGELNFDYSFNEDTRVRVIGQGMTEEVGRLQGTTEQKERVWGVMGSAVVDAYGFSLGGGGWQGSGIGVRTVLESGDAANPLAYDSDGKMRNFRGFFGNVAYDYHGTALAVGGGSVWVQSSARDIEPNGGRSVIAQSQEFHVVFTQKYDAITFVAEYMNWKNRWYWGEKQNVNFTGVGANFTW